jgi:primosomal protein N' (replication factor Y)
LAASLVLDAHDQAYQEERAPTASAWDVVVERSARDGAPCRLVSPCPTAEQVARFGPVHGPGAAGPGGWPSLAVVDRRGDDPRTGLFSDDLVRLARQVAAAGGPFVCVLNRTGRARLLACASCGGLARCDGCGRAVELAEGSDPEAGDVLRCRGCGAERPVVCPSCGATRMKVLRAGVSRVREELAALLGVEVTEVSGPPAASGGEPAGTGGWAPVVVGTEAVLHRVRRAGGVAFLDIDQHLLAPRYAAAEETLALLVRAGRLVGGRGTGGSGTVMVQTRMPDHDVLAAVAVGDPAPVTGSELALRRQLRLPPFGALAAVSGEGAPAFCAALAGVGSGGAGIEVSDTGGGRWLVRGPDHRVLCDALAATERPPGRLRVAVDPTDL